MPLKKLASIILLLVYGLSSSGMTIQFHYCCGKLKNVQLSPISEKQCGMKHSSSKKCCDDKKVELKLKSDQRTEATAKFNFSVPVLLKTESENFNSTLFVGKTVSPEVFAPPPQSTSLCVLNCVFRI